MIHRTCAKGVVGLAALGVVLASVPSAARAQEEPVEVNYLGDSAIALGALAAAYLINRLPVDTEVQWSRELLGPLDLRVRANFSRTASRISDVSLILTATAPLVVTFSDGFDQAAWDRALVYGEVLAITTVPAAIAKILVERPRPYTYSKASFALALRKGAGHDSHKSFYSGHSSTAFASAVASSLLYTTQNDNKEARAVAWGLQLALAAGTANLRVRAGKHFYSDVIVGALIGSSIAYGVVALHSEAYRPSGTEFAAMGAGTAIGLAISALLPLSTPIGDPPNVGETISVLPIPIEGGLGLSLSGAL